MPAHLIADEGPQRGLILNLEQGDEWIIGRDPDEASFVLNDTTVSRRHARLVRSAEGIYLENLSTVTPTHLNHHLVDEPLLLKEGDKVQIGQTVFLFSEQEVQPARPIPKKDKTDGYDDIFGSLEEPSEDLPIFGEKEDERETTSQSSAYDTIFEDAEEEEQFPFQLLSDTPLLLKVISGPNAGAEIGLEKDRSYTIGKDPISCDIVFQDLSVSRNHARLEIAADGTAFIEDLGSRNGTVVNGTTIDKKTPILAEDLVALGTTVFLVVDREEPQETIYSPAMSAYEHAKTSGLPAEMPAESGPIEEKVDWKQEPIPRKHLVAAGSFAAIFLIIFISFFSLFKSKQVEVAHKEPKGQIEKSLAKFPAVQFSFNPASGKLFLVGHVLTAVDAQELQYRVGTMDFVTSVEDNVIIDEMVAKMMNDVLSANPDLRGASIQTQKPGAFAAVGYVDTNAEAAELSEYLNLNFPYLDRLDNQVVVGENLNMQIQALLQMKGFSALTFQYGNGIVILSGNYSDKMKDALGQLVKDIDSIRGVSQVKNFATAASLAAIDISQQFQVSGTALHDHSGYGAVLNGKIYVLGDAINGMTITEIDPSTILLEKDGIKYKINYNR